MLTVAASLLFVLVVLVISEYLWRRKLLRGEWARKSVHMLIGSFVAFWPWLMSWQQIQLISLAFLAVVLIDRRYKFFHAILSVKRRSLGDVAFAVGVGLSALITTNKTYFMLGVLHMALADGLAAVIGNKYGRRWEYKIFGSTKTVIGSMAFWMISLWILGIGLLLSTETLPYDQYMLALIFIPPAATLVENLSIMGLDNILVPIVVISLLQVL